jgi:hypothetical protein
MADTQIYGNYAFKLEGLKGAESGLKFFQGTMPGFSVEITVPKAFGENGPPVPLSGGGHQVTWNPITLTRYVDDNTALYDWSVEVKDKGKNDETVQEPTVTCIYNDQPLFMWKLMKAVPTRFEQNSANAQTHDLMTETVTITYEEAEMTR